MSSAPLLAEPLLTVVEAAALLKVSSKTLYRLARLGLVPCRRLWSGPRKGVVRFVRRDLEEWLAGQAVPPVGVVARTINVPATVAVIRPTSRRQS